MCMQQGGAFVAFPFSFGLKNKDSRIWVRAKIEK